MKAELDIATFKDIGWTNSGTPPELRACLDQKHRKLDINDNQHDQQTACPECKILWHTCLD